MSYEVVWTSCFSAVELIVALYFVFDRKTPLEILLKSCCRKLKNKKKMIALKGIYIFNLLFSIMPHHHSNIIYHLC